MSEEATAYARDGYFVHSEPLLPSELVHRARAGMDAVRRGEYDTDRPPQPSPWNPGDDEHVLCKIEMPQLANSAIRELVGHEALGRWAANEVSGRKTNFLSRDARSNLRLGPPKVDLTLIKDGSRRWARWQLGTEQAGDVARVLCAHTNRNRVGVTGAQVAQLQTEETVRATAVRSRVIPHQPVRALSSHPLNR